MFAQLLNLLNITKGHDMTIGILAFIAILFLPTMVLGGLILALLQGLGFKYVIKTPKLEMPAFSKRFLIQLLVTLTLIALVLLAYFLMSQALHSAFEQAQESPTSSLELMAQVGLMTKFLSFGTSKLGLILSCIFWAASEIVFYVLLVAIFTKMLTKFNLFDGVKSQTFTIIILVIFNSAIVGSLIYELKDMPTLNAELASTVQSEANIHIKDAPAASSGTSELNGVWIINEEKSKALCDEVEDATLKFVCQNSVNSAVISTANSDGILIENAILQDGPNVCNIATRNEAGFQYSCVNPLDRSIYARINLNTDKTITMGLNFVSLILMKK